MATTVYFDIFGMEDYIKDMAKIEKQYDKKEKSFLLKEGRKLRNNTLYKAEKTVDKHTGHLFEGIKRGAYYKYQERDGTVRVYGGKPAYHVHLIEYGHNIQHEKGGKVLGRTKAFNIFGTAGDKYEKKFEKNCEKFRDEVIKALE